MDLRDRAPGTAVGLVDSHALGMEAPTRAGKDGAPGRERLLELADALIA